MAARSRASGGDNDGQPTELTLPLRRETRDHIQSITPTFKPRANDNVGLWLDKLVVRRAGPWTLDKDDRTRAFTRFRGERQSAFGKHAALRQRAMLGSLHDENLSWQRAAAIDGRLLVDYGRATATEASISFHPAWGVPRIPGTALKGITRAQMAAEASERDETQKCLFGSEPQSEPLQPGCIVFYDALPVDGKFELDLDVLTPHHCDYYAGKGPPAEWEEPNPFTFLSVVKTRFLFSVGYVETRASKEQREPPQKLLETAARALQAALKEAGVGAKTAAGYGRFRDFVEIK